MGKHIRKNKKLAKLLFLIYILFMLSIILTNGFAKFRTAYASKSTAQIARPIINVVTDTLTIEDLHNEEYEWNFIVNNYNSVDEINQVELSYKIKIDMKELVNVEYKLYKIDEETKTELQLVDGTTEQEFELPYESMKEDKYCLIIKTADGISTESIQSNIIINVSATQKI